jgi:hypothetical protein
MPRVGDFGLILGRFKRLFRPSRRTVDRHRLVSRHLSRANRLIGSSLRGSGTRERQDGKISQNVWRG